MENRDNIKKELEEITPLLAGLNKPGRPKIPELYFEGFANRLISNMELDTKKIVQPVKQHGILHKVWWFFAQPRYAFASATAVLVIVSCIFIFPGREVNKETAFNVSQEEASEYIVQHIDQFDTRSLVDEDFTETEIDNLMDETIPQAELDQIINENIENLNIEDLL